MFPAKACHYSVAQIQRDRGCAEAKTNLIITARKVCIPNDRTVNCGPAKHLLGGGFEPKVPTRIATAKIYNGVRTPPDLSKDHNNFDELLRVVIVVSLVSSEADWTMFQRTFTSAERALS